MVEGIAKSGQNESFPLLKENSFKGCGDCCSRSPSRTDDINSTHQSILIEDKKTWLPQWTGLLTVCWVLSFVLAMGLAGQILASCFITTFSPHSLFLSPCYFNESIRSNKLFLIELVPRSMSVRIFQYSEYFSYMAKNYQNLNITVIFLLDDANPRNGFKKLFFRDSENIRPPIISQKDIMGQRMFNCRFENLKVKFVNVSSLLSRRMVPFSTRFYAKVFYMWMYGGVALDFFNCYLDYITNNRNNRYLDLLNFFNDNVNIEGYRNFLIDRTDDYQETDGQFIVASRFEIVFNPETTNLTSENANRTMREDVEDLTRLWSLNNTNITEDREIQPNSNTTGNNSTNVSYFNNLANGTTILTYLYDFAILRPPKAIRTETLQKDDVRSLVAIDSNGMFLASSAPKHPFIGNLLKTYNKHSFLHARTRISYVIKNIYSIACGGRKFASYCANVYIL